MFLYSDQMSTLVDDQNSFHVPLRVDHKDLMWLYYHHNSVYEFQLYQKKSVLKHIRIKYILGFKKISVKKFIGSKIKLGLYRGHFFTYFTKISMIHILCTLAFLSYPWFVLHLWRKVSITHIYFSQGGKTYMRGVQKSAA